MGPPQKPALVVFGYAVCHPWRLRAIGSDLGNLIAVHVGIPKMNRRCGSRRTDQYAIHVGLRHQQVVCRQTTQRIEQTTIVKEQRPQRVGQREHQVVPRAFRQAAILNGNLLTGGFLPHGGQDRQWQVLYKYFTCGQRSLPQV